MAGARDLHGTQLSRGIQEPERTRTTPEKSTTLQHQRIAQRAAVRTNPNPFSPPARLNHRKSSQESNGTGESDGKKWFDQSNLAPATTLDAGSMDADPPFFQEKNGQEKEERRKAIHKLGTVPSPRVGGSDQGPLLMPPVARSNSTDDYRSVIDDLTIENKRLKEELRRYKQFGNDMLRKEKLFEIKVHGLPWRKKRELEATLRNFAASLAGSEEAYSQPRKPRRLGKNIFSSGESMSKHASSSSSHSRPVDSAYASMSTGPSSHAAHSSGPPILRPSVGGGRARSSKSKVENYLSDTPDGLFPRHIIMTDKEKKKLVVRRLEQLFTGKLGVGVRHTTTSNPFSDAQTSGDSIALRPRRNTESTREAVIQRQDSTQKSRSRDNLSTSNSNGDQTESPGNGGGSGDGSGSGGRTQKTNTTPPESSAPLEQRPTRPGDLDPDRRQVPSENMEYIRHLGLVTPAFLIGRPEEHKDVSPDADGWVFLNLLCNLAQLHMLNVTPSFIRLAVTEKSAKFQLSPDGNKIRWRGGTDGTKFSGDSSMDNSQNSPSTDDAERSPGSSPRKKPKLTESALSSKKPKLGPETSSSSDEFQYKPLFIHQSTSADTSPEETASLASYDRAEESNPGNTKYSESGSPQRRKRRHDGAIIYYSGAPFCTDLSGDPGELSPTTYYMTSSGQRLDSSVSSAPWRPLQRSLSGSSLPIRPLSDERAVVNEHMDVDLDDDPDLLLMDDKSQKDDEIDLPWCDQPEKVHLRPIEPTLEPCGLGGVLPDDHFAVVVTTRRPIVSAKAGPPQVRQPKAKDDATTNAPADRFVSIRTAPPLSALTSPRSDHPIEIEYLSGRVEQLKPVPLPPPAVFFPPFSSGSESESEGDDSGLDGDDEFLGLESSLEEPLYPSNPRLSDTTSRVNGLAPSSNLGDGMDGIYEPSDGHAAAIKMIVSPDISTGGSAGLARRRRARVQPDSSAATAGGAESCQTSIDADLQ